MEVSIFSLPLLCLFDVSFFFNCLLQRKSSDDYVDMREMTIILHKLLICTSFVSHREHILLRWMLVGIITHAWDSLSMSCSMMIITILTSVVINLTVASCRQCPYIIEAIIALAELGLSAKDIISLFPQVCSNIVSRSVIWGSIPNYKCRNMFIFLELVIEFYLDHSNDSLYPVRQCVYCIWAKMCQLFARTFGTDFVQIWIYCLFFMMC